MTANERFKKSYGATLWGGITAATLLHFSLFFFFPEMSAADVSYDADKVEVIELPPEVVIPPPPEAIARPARPVIATTDIDEDITIAPTTFEDNPVEELPPPPEEVTQGDLSEAPVFTPMTVRPDIRNRDEVARALEREYPPLLRDAGIGGSTDVWFFIDETGKVVRTLVNQSSGHQGLDDAALRVADIIVFTPALNMDRRVPVWISLPITFISR